MISFYWDLLYDIRRTNTDLTNIVFDKVFNQFCNEFATCGAKGLFYDYGSLRHALANFCHVSHVTDSLKCDLSFKIRQLLSICVLFNSAVVMPVV
jgi:hypothetical protein